VRSVVAELLADVGAAFGGLGARWYVFGAQAAIFHGAVRLTADVDVTVDPGNRATAELVDALGRHGIVLRVADVGGFVDETRVLPMLHARSRMPVDVVLAGPGLEELFLARAEVHRIEGVSVPVAAADDLVAMKVLAGRPKDLDDVVAIVAAQGARFNLERAMATVRLLERALDRRDLMAHLDEAVARARRTLRGEGGSERDRGW
jgi:hypothetical protein